MIKAIAIFTLILVSGAAQAEGLSPWFGSEVSPPGQIAINITANARADSAKNPDCSIYDCKTLAKIAKPEQKSAANP